jgi:hypothetical protein
VAESADSTSHMPVKTGRVGEKQAAKEGQALEETIEVDDASLWFLKD